MLIRKKLYVPTTNLFAVMFFSIHCALANTAETSHTLSDADARDIIACTVALIHTGPKIIENFGWVEFHLAPTKGDLGDLTKPTDVSYLTTEYRKYITRNSDALDCSHQTSASYATSLENPTEAEIKPIRESEKYNRIICSIGVPGRLKNYAAIEYECKIDAPRAKEKANARYCPSGLYTAIMRMRVILFNRRHGSWHYDGDAESGDFLPSPNQSNGCDTTVEVY